jgi:DnaJ-class molecular chaperone
MTVAKWDSARLKERLMKCPTCRGRGWLKWHLPTGSRTDRKQCPECKGTGEVAEKI